MDSLELARFIAHTAEDKKAEHIVILDLRAHTLIADYFVICSGTSDRQLKALTDYVRVGVKEQHARLPYSTEGTPDSGWVLMDYGDVIVHLFLQEERDYYDLEGLWRKESNVLLNIQ